MSEQHSIDRLVDDCAACVLGAFDEYQREFRSVTRRAFSRFVNRDWQGLRADVVDRLDVYANAVSHAVGELGVRLAGRITERSLWARLKLAYGQTLVDLDDIELAETFFNSVTRRIFSTVGVDAEIEFVRLDCEPVAKTSRRPVVRTHHRQQGPTSQLVREILVRSPLGSHFVDLEATSWLITREIENACRRRWATPDFDRIEVLAPLFYRGFGAYIIGRVVRGDQQLPLAIPFLCLEGGVVVDAVLSAEDEVSIVFSFTRSYFLVDHERPREIVEFLQQIMPKKPIAELYISIGYNKHGKTMIYRNLLGHLRRSDDQFIVAPGDPGLVMVVFTMPSHDLVFKVIRDRFSYPKTSVREDVLERYQLVFRHDRAGRLVDAQEFEWLEFDRGRFSDELLEKLLTLAGETVSLEDDRVVIRHLYTERRVAPLNLYLKQASPADARRAVIDYGQAIKDLASSNIFPGDLLLKNFGVTRHARVIFYDYDELCFVTDCHFRELPPARHAEDEMRGEAWFFVDERDVFPEEFASFVGLPEELVRTLRDAHGEIFTGAFWREMQARHQESSFIPIFAYPEACRIRGRGAALDDGAEPQLS
ncbi:MAG: bifunctional isocitrate dehydrogenase kinase/phosphatase [Acidobacteriota bacterium]|nr:MAG: bifunctional isocitrate dehydrogenase kinase/phosphatase [Acidobacteriota bacterium]